jgi:molybdopterin converting factor small subunit
MGAPMARVVFTANLQRHIACPPCQAEGATVRAVLEAVFARNEAARGYVLDEQGELRQHMLVFVNGEQVRDRIGLSDAVADDAEVYVMQALSGG